MKRSAFPKPTGNKVHGVGVRVRHSRSCAAPLGRECPCGPGYEAFVYSWDTGAKIRRTFRTWDEAVRWRRETLRQMYCRSPRRAGKLDSAYSELRRCAQELEGARVASENRRRRADVGAILDHVYRAEDELLALLGAD